MNGSEIIDELNTGALSADRTDAEELPFETLDDFSTAPLTLAETAEMVRQKTEYFFGLSVKFNRRSEKYLEACEFLHKGVSYLGSCCLTIELLRQKGKEVPEVEELSTHWLYGLVSFNVRKLNAAADAFIAAGCELPGKWLDMQFRFLKLAERLKATEHRIWSCFGDTSEFKEKIVTRAHLFTKDAANKKYVQRNIKPPVFRAPASLPVHKEAVREALGADARITVSTTQFRIQDSGSGIQESGPRESVNEVRAGADPEGTIREGIDHEQNEAVKFFTGKTIGERTQDSGSGIQDSGFRESMSEIRADAAPEGTIWEGIDHEKNEALDFFTGRTIGELEMIRARDPGLYCEMQRKAFGARGAPLSVKCEE